MSKPSATPASRKPAAGVGTKKGPWVRRHPVLALGTVAAGVGAYALLPRKGGAKSATTNTKCKAGTRTAKSAQ